MPQPTEVCALVLGNAHLLNNSSSQNLLKPTATLRRCTKKNGCKKRWFTAEEKTLLQQLVLDNESVILSRKNDGVSVHLKKEVWLNIADQFNNHPQTVTHRSSVELRRCWENMKFKAKKTLHRVRQQLESVASGTGTTSMVFMENGNRCSDSWSPADLLATNVEVMEADGDAKFSTFLDKNGSTVKTDVFDTHNQSNNNSKADFSEMMQSIHTNFFNVSSVSELSAKHCSALEKNEPLSESSQSLLSNPVIHNIFFTNSNSINFCKSFEPNSDFELKDSNIDAQPEDTSCSKSVETVSNTISSTDLVGLTMSVEPHNSEKSTSRSSVSYSILDSTRATPSPMSKDTVHIEKSGAETLIANEDHSSVSSGTDLLAGICDNSINVGHNGSSLLLPPIDNQLLRNPKLSQLHSTVIAFMDVLEGQGIVKHGGDDQPTDLSWSANQHEHCDAEETCLDLSNKQSTLAEPPIEQYVKSDNGNLFADVLTNWSLLNSGFLLFPGNLDGKSFIPTNVDRSVYNLTPSFANFDYDDRLLQSLEHPGDNKLLKEGGNFTSSTYNSVDSNDCNLHESNQVTDNSKIEEISTNAVMCDNSKSFSASKIDDLINHLLVSSSHEFRNKALHLVKLQGDNAILQRRLDLIESQKCNALEEHQRRIELMQQEHQERLDIIAQELAMKRMLCQLQIEQVLRVTKQ